MISYVITQDLGSSGIRHVKVNNDKLGRKCQRLSLCHFVTADAGFWFALGTTQLATVICGESAVLETNII